MSRYDRRSTGTGKQWKSIPVITPRHHRYAYWFWKFKNKESFTEEFKLAIANPTLRCLDCGCKYDLKIIDHCPKCSSQRSSVLENEDFLTDPAVQVGFGFFVIFLLVTKPIWIWWLH